MSEFLLHLLYLDHCSRNVGIILFRNGDVGRRAGRDVGSEELLEELVRKKGDTELRGRTAHTGHAALEECLGSFGGEDLPEAVTDSGVGLLACSGLHL